MLLALANWIASDVRAFSVFGYITLRGVLATMEREQAAIGHTDAHCNAAGQPT